MGKKGSVVIGFKYLMGLHMGVSRGPVNEMVSIKVGDRYAFSENSTSGVESIKTSQRIYIDKPDLFGGEKKEGGLEGDLDIMFGDWNQGINSDLESMLGGAVPAFRRMFTLFFNGVICAMNPYPKTWEIRARRSTAGWSGPVFYPEKAAIEMQGPPVPAGFEGSDKIIAMNGAHILWEAATNTEWGRGHPTSIMNAPSFIDAANTLCAEKFGLCLRWVRTDDLDVFVQQVLDHIGGVLYQDRETGLITLDLIRAPAEGATIPVVEDGAGLLRVVDLDTSSSNTAINEMIVKYHDPVFNADRSVRVQNSGSQQAQQAVFSETKEYPGVPTAELANRLALRDLKALGLPLKRFEVHMDRRGWRIRPGSLFILNAPESGINNMRVRVGNYKEGGLEDGEIVLTVVQDVFSFPEQTYVDVQPPAWVPPQTSAAVAWSHALQEASWRDLVRRLSAADLANVDPNAGSLAARVRKPTALSSGYELWLDTGSGYAKAADCNFTPAVTVSQDPGHYGTTFYYSDSTDLGAVSVGSAGYIGGEIVRIDAIDTANKKLTVARGCVDTIPTQHLLNAVLYLFDDFLGTDNNEYAISEVVNTKYRTKAAGSILNLDEATSDNLTIVARQNKPYPPADLRCNGALVLGPDVAFVGDMAFTWAHRDRTGQADQLVGHTEGSTGPEAGTTYTIRVYKTPFGAPVHTESGITGTSWTYTASAMQTDTAVTGEQPLSFEVEAVRGGVTSFQKYTFSVTWVPSGTGGFGLDFGNNFGG